MWGGVGGVHKGPVSLSILSGSDGNARRATKPEEGPRCVGERAAGPHRPTVRLLSLPTCLPSARWSSCCGGLAKWQGLIELMFG